MIEIDDESTEGGEAIAYYNKGNLKLIIATGFGETEKRKIECYFDGDKLFFAFNKNYKYNRPIYYDEKEAKENNDTAFNPQKTNIQQDRYYFNNRKLICWINNKKIVNTKSPEFIKSEKEVLEDSDNLRGKFKKQL